METTTVEPTAASRKVSEVYIRKVAPLGDPVEITIRGYELSLRKHDAACVEVKQK